MDLAAICKVTVLCTAQIMFYVIESVIKWFVPKQQHTHLKGKVVLITGSAGGLGQLVAMKFGALGCKVVLWDIDSEKNEETARYILDYINRIATIAGASNAASQLMLSTTIENRHRNLEQSTKKQPISSNANIELVETDNNCRGHLDCVALVRLSEAEGAEAHPYVCDVTNNDAITKIANDVKKDVGPVDILINNAGIVQGKSFMETTEEDLRKTFAVNTFLTFSGKTCKEFLPEMMERNSGHIVTISSVAGRFGTGGLTDYCASKFACAGFHESLLLELIGNGYDGIYGTLI
ncbi:Retinol dehydrogenase 10-B [Nymphon striatum]|nr:Retinol dehydrogenase 10-B [Nymphon striatum]